MLDKKVFRVWARALAVSCFLVALWSGVGIGARPQSRPIETILPERARAELVNSWLAWRLDYILPRIMRQEGIDLWLVINREYNEDPVYLTLVPEPIMSARRTSILLFHDRGGEKGVDRLNGGTYGLDGLYRPAWRTRPGRNWPTWPRSSRGSTPGRSPLISQKIGLWETDSAPH